MKIEEKDLIMNGVYLPQRGWGSRQYPRRIIHIQKREDGTIIEPIGFERINPKKEPVRWMESKSFLRWAGSKEPQS